MILSEKRVKIRDINELIQFFFISLLLTFFTQPHMILKSVSNLDFALYVISYLVTNIVPYCEICAQKISYIFYP